LASKSVDMYVVVYISEDLAKVCRYRSIDFERHKSFNLIILL